MSEDKKKGRYAGKAGRVGKQKDHYKDQFGLTGKKAQKRWNNEDLNRLLDAFLNTPRGGIALAAMFERAHTNGVYKILDKLAINHGAEAKDKRPAMLSRYSLLANRINREGLPFSDKERAMLQRATSKEGISRNAHNPEWIGSLFNRPADEIRRYFEKLHENSRLPLEPITTPMYDDLVKRVNKILAAATDLKQILENADKEK